MLRRRRPRAGAAARRAPPVEPHEPDAALRAAVAHLARRDYCSAELGARLQADGFVPAAVETALEQLRERRYLDDERYARSLVAARAERGQGPLRIRSELLGLGLAGPLAEAALQEYAVERDWARLAREVRIRRFGLAAPKGRAQLARQARFLQYRGFSHDHIRGALGEDVPGAAD